MLCRTTQPSCLKADLFVQKPIVHRITKFNEAAVKELAESFGKAIASGQTVFPVVIDSYGGEVYGLLGMVEMIRSSPIPVATVIEGKAMSAGAMIAALGSKGYRYIGHHSHILIHHVSSYADGIVPHIKADVAQTEEVERQLFGLVDEWCGHKQGFFLDKLKPREGADWYVKPAEALGLGLVDHVGSPILDVQVTVSTRLVL